MSLTQAIFIIGSIGVFQNKAFLPAFLAATILRFGPEVEFIQQNAPIFTEVVVPSWFIADPTVAILGFLSFLEFAATKDPQLNELMQDFDQWIKSLLHVFTSLGLMSTIDAETAAAVFGIEGLDPLTTGAAIVAAPVVYVASSARNQIVKHIFQLDPENDWGLQTIVSFAEDIWVFAAMIFLIFFPVVALVFIGLISLGVWLVDRTFKKADEQKRIVCNCGQTYYRSISHCPSCGLENEEVMDLGFFGQVTDTSSFGDDKGRRLKHLTHKRCSSCGFHIKGKPSELKCENCGHTELAEPSQVGEYLEHIQRRLPLVLIIGFLLGLVPVVGFIVGFIYYRKRLIAPLCVYLSTWSKIGTRVCKGFIIFTLAVIQFMPLVGIFSLPLLIIIDYGLTIQAFRRTVSHLNTSLKPIAY